MKRKSYNKLNALQCKQEKKTTLDNNRWGFDSWHCRWKWTVAQNSLANPTKSDHIFEMCVCAWMKPQNNRCIHLLAVYVCCHLSKCKMDEKFFRWKKNASFHMQKWQKSRSDCFAVVKVLFAMGFTSNLLAAHFAYFPSIQISKLWRDISLSVLAVCRTALMHAPILWTSR